MVKQIIAFALIAFVFLSSTCKKQMQLPDPELKKIFGRWEWVESSGGFAGKTLTPMSENYKIQLEFGNNGIYKKYENNSLVDRKKFFFLPAKSIHSLQQVWSLSFIEPKSPHNINPFTMAVSFPGKDTLMLNEQLHDGFQHVYVRIK